MDYLIAKAHVARGACRLQALEDVERDYEFYDGISRLADFPVEARFSMDEDYPDDIRTDDFISNIGSLLVISDRTRQVLESCGLAQNELLPVTIINHKGRKEKGPFYILHQVGLQDCIDLTQTVHTRNAIDPSLLSSIKGLVLDPKRIDPKIPIFRMKHFPYAPVFRKDVTVKINEAGLTGIKFVEPALYKD